MDINPLVIFAKVVELQSFTKASLVMGLEKSTVSSKVSQLEQRLGVRLLNRTTRSVTPTEVGEGYYHYCRQINEKAEDADLYIESLSKEPLGVLRVTVPPDLGLVLIREVIAPFMQAYPKVEVELDMSQRHVDLVSERFDLALRVTSRTLQDSSLIAKKIRAISTGLFAAPSFIDQYGLPKTPTQASMMQGISFGIEDRDFSLTKQGKQFSFKFDKRLLTSDVLACKEAAIAGVGIAILPHLIIENQLENRTLVPLLEDYKMPTAILYAVYPSRHWLPTKVKTFLQFLEEWG